MGFRMRSPSIKIGGARFRKTKNGITMSSKTIFGNRKTTNLKTGRTTKTYKSIIPGKSTQITKDAKGNVKVSKKYNPSLTILGTRLRKTQNGVSISSKNFTGGTNTYNTGTKTKTKSYKTIIPGLSYRKKSYSKTVRVNAFVGISAYL